MMNSSALPDGLLLTFYGDDFTGSSAVMEVMTFAGLPAVMFIEPPTPEQLERFAGHRAIGIASTARARPPDWMDANLPRAFRALAALRAPIAHYKVCSTLDSSATIGSIGRAIDIGVPILTEGHDAAAWQPLVIAAPAIRRYQAFGNVFAGHSGSIYRLDRHPVMQRHPVTPMDESDVRLHLAKQTARPIGLVDFVAMKDGSAQSQFNDELKAGRSIVSLDVVDEETLRWVGKLIWTNRRRGLFAIGSQGVEYALVAHWRAERALAEPAPRRPAARVAQMIAASGSTSSATASQIDWAEAHGFEVIALSATAVLDERQWRAELERVFADAGVALSQGRSPLVATARGPGDPAIEQMRERLSSSGFDPLTANARLGAGLGETVARVARKAGLSRGAVSGGDTSGFAMRAIGAYALEAIAPLAPGSPLCRLFSSEPHIETFEVALKGGQMGAVDFFGAVREGRAIN
jgi:uncharacterized protein YgbK (DUF1537 family)